VQTCHRSGYLVCRTVALATAGVVLWVGAATAEGKLEARYTVTLAGVPIGKGAWVIDVADGQYTAAASGMTTGLLRVFASGQGSSASRGQINGSGQLVPSTYASSISSGKWSEDLRITLANGNVKEVSIDPPVTPHPDRVPVTDAHRKGVSDPMSAALVAAPGNGNAVTAEVCNRRAAIFDGRMRYDLRMAFKRIEEVKADKGYEGGTVVCALYFSPVAGYIPDRPAIKYLIAQKDMEVWFAPVAGTRLMVPFRVSIPTPLGLGVLQATQFMTGAQLPRATPTSVRVR
jgi:hypothetical protein